MAVAQFHWICSYDICHPKRLVKIHQLLCMLGIAINYSVFYLYLTQQQFQTVDSAVKKDAHLARKFYRNRAPSWRRPVQGARLCRWLMPKGCWPIRFSRWPRGVPATGQAVLVTLDQWNAVADHDGPIGLRVPNTLDPALMSDKLPRLALVVLEFPKFTDGRAYSQARFCATATVSPARFGQRARFCAIRCCI